MDLLQHRKSHTSIGEIYFWTATIHKWMHLLNSDLIATISTFTK